MDKNTTEIIGIIQTLARVINHAVVLTPIVDKKLVDLKARKKRKSPETPIVRKQKYQWANTRPEFGKKISELALTGGEFEFSTKGLEETKRESLHSHLCNQANKRIPKTLEGANNYRTETILDRDVIKIFVNAPQFQK